MIPLDKPTLSLFRYKRVFSLEDCLPVEQSKLRKHHSSRLLELSLMPADVSLKAAHRDISFNVDFDEQNG